MQKLLLIIHPQDSTTTFLDKIKNHLNNELPDITHHFNIKLNDESHQNCIQNITDHSESGLIIFMGHGRSDFLYGSKGKYYGELVSEDAKKEHPENYFYLEKFITTNNIGVFNNKKIICLSCNSNGKIANEAIKNGTKVFLGFGELPTSIEELKEQGEENKAGTSLSLIEKILKSEINYFIKKSVEYAIKNKYTFEQLYDFIRFVTNQKISFYLKDQSKIKERKIIANYLYDFKKGIEIFGNKKEFLID